MKDTKRPQNSANRQAGDPNHQPSRDKNMDKTLEDSFPSSDPPSTIPNPGERDIKEQAD